MKENKFNSGLGNVVNNIFGAKMNYKLRYYHQRGHWPNLKHPGDMSEILISKMFNEPICRDLSQYVDKVAMRDYIKSKGLESILLKHYGVWDKPEDIPFDELPNHFILKSNNGCGHHVICRDKMSFDPQKAIETLHLAIKSGQEHVERHYRYITPKVFAEELIETPDGDLPIDYKFTCIGGEIMDVFVATERATGAKYSTMDLEWNVLPYIKDVWRPKTIPPQPHDIKALADVAKVLSKDFDFVRVDLYEYRNQPYISELTFFPWGGFLYGYSNEAIKRYGGIWLEHMNNIK